MEIIEESLATLLSGMSGAMIGIRALGRDAGDCLRRAPAERDIAGALDSIDRMVQLADRLHNCGIGLEQPLRARPRDYEAIAKRTVALRFELRAGPDEADRYLQRNAMVAAVDAIQAAAMAVLGERALGGSAGGMTRRKRS